MGLIQQTSDMGGWSQQGWDGGLGPLRARSFDDSMTTRRVRPSVTPRCEGLQRFDKCVDILTQVPYVPLQFVPVPRLLRLRAGGGPGVRAGQPE